GVIQKKFDALATAIFVITNGLAGRWLNSRIASSPLPALVSPARVATVREKIESLQRDRGTIVESLISEAWDSASARLAKIRTSTVYEDTMRRPVNGAAVKDVYKPYRLDC
ncbi:MAG: hypothetical protein AB7H77_05785, partial [Bdellovibrionales bacterium]